ncbi:ceramide synthase 2-like isoform X2 [Polyodon spathula]|uniref:ceramide synthase 2-like isoform X2 n=1 Tax=Polyodon spathula TaxID=7913 RepID=UPI001B7F1B9A|nr:ceramide synthase 2-like isoform X2 [Polyodon spathula]
MESLLDRWLWRQEYWLPPGVTWADMVETESVQYPQPRDLLITLPLSLVFIAARYAFERLVALPLSWKMGVRDTTRPVLAVQNVTLEVFYKQQSRSPSQSQFHSLSKQCDLSQRQIERWFRLRRNQDRPSNSKKFCEACWRFTFYMIAFLAGLAVLVDKPWFWDPSECWVGYPQQPLQTSQYWYYMTELAFYWSLLLRVSFDVKRKDFKEQVIHHIATIFLMGFSYCANYIRVGTLVLLVHDASDYLLEVERDERSDEEENHTEEEEEEEEETRWERRKCTFDSKLPSLANNCVFNNLTNQRNGTPSRQPKAR